MSDSNKILLFSDYLFFSKLVELPVSIKQKDIRFFAENELESSSPISIDILKWAYVKIGSSLLIFASTADRLAQAGYTYEDMDSALYAVPEIGLLAKLKFADGWNLVEMKKSLNAIYVENGEWKSFASMELGAGEFSAQCESFVKQNAVADYKLYSFENFSQASFSTINISLKGENCDSIKTSFKASSSFSTLDIRDQEFLKELRAEILKTKAIALLIKAVPVFVLILIAMQVSLYFKQAGLGELEAKAAQLAPTAKKLQDVSEQVTSAKNFAKGQLFNALLLAKLNSLRPSGVAFSKTKANSATEMVINGDATNLSLLNEYIDLLKKEDYIENIEPETSSKSAGAKFKLTVKFKEII